MSGMPPVAVLAGGLATRMRPLTETVPKAMLEVFGEPFISHQLRLFKREGIERVVLCVGHLGNLVEGFVGDGHQFGLEVSYSYDGDKLLGTGGAIRKALPHLADSFLLIYGDSYLDIDYPAVVRAFEASKKPALMTVLHNHGQWDLSNIEFVGGNIRNYSKKPTPEMEYIDYGMSVVKRSIFDHTPTDEAFDLASLYSTLVQQGDMAGYEVERRFFEIGSHAGLTDLDEYLRFGRHL